jgi:hypothetical protein
VAGDGPAEQSGPRAGDGLDAVGEDHVKQKPGLDATDPR